MKLVDRLGLEETRKVPDPFGLGVVFEIRHHNCPQYQEHVKAHGESAAMQKIEAVVRKASVIAGVQSRGDQSKFDELFAKQVDKMFDSVPDEELTFTGVDLEGIAKLVAGWEGEDEPFSEELLVSDLLKATEPIPHEIVDGEFSVAAGTALGAAMAPWFIFQSKQHAEFRTETVEAVAKN